MGALLNSALRPLQSIQLAWNTLFDRLDGWIRTELSGVPSDELREPPAIVVGGVVAGLLFAQEEIELRNLFVRLLATSMVKSTSSKAHPAFAELIKQMTAVEARIIAAFLDQGAVPFLKVKSCIPKEGRTYEHWQDPKPGMTLREIRNLASSPWGEPWDTELIWSMHDIGAFSDHAPLIASLQNLQRLSLVEITQDIVVDGDEA